MRLFHWKIAILLLVAAVGFYAWTKLRSSGLREEFVSGNRRALCLGC